MRVFEIADGLYISGKFQDESELESTGIHFDVVVNLWNRPDNLTLLPIGKRMYINWPMRDGQVKEQVNFLLPLANMLKELVLAGKLVLIHCQGGRNRSALLAVLIMKLHNQNSETDWVEYTRKIRGPSAFNNEEFVKFLGEIDVRSLP